MLAGDLGEADAKDSRPRVQGRRHQFADRRGLRADPQRPGPAPWPGCASGSNMSAQGLLNHDQIEEPAGSASSRVQMINKRYRSRDLRNSGRHRSAREPRRRVERLAVSANILLAVTLEDPAGNGPEIIAAAWSALRRTGPKLPGHRRRCDDRRGRLVRPNRIRRPRCHRASAEALPVLTQPLVCAGSPWLQPTDAAAAPVVIACSIDSAVVPGAGRRGRRRGHRRSPRPRSTKPASPIPASNEIRPRCC